MLKTFIIYYIITFLIGFGTYTSGHKFKWWHLFTSCIMVPILIGYILGLYFNKKGDNNG